MNDDQMDDLKQFIAATVSQTEARLGGRIDGVETKVGSLETKVDRLEVKVDSLRHEMLDGFAGVAGVVDPANDQLEDHEKRITSLEHQTA